MTVVENTDYPFALCLTHDVDRPYKTYQSLFYAVTERAPSHLLDLLPGRNPYWQFETITDLESDLGVRSAFYFLNEPPVWTHSPTDLLDFDALVQALGRYDVRDPDLATVLRRLEENGWEVGLHGSFHTPDDRERLQREKSRIESVIDGEIRGGRQHYLNLEIPDTWRHHEAIGLKYDASLGSRTECGFQFGYDVVRPFDDEFVVFPLTLMEQHLPDPGEEFARAWEVCESLLDTAAAERAVMTALFHPRYFCDRDFPGYRRLYRQLVEGALERGAWVGSPGQFYEEFLVDERQSVAERA
jgi:peptidoglycan/xylan/chitin deacetylase (PgdA/CDA1 family)